MSDELTEGSANIFPEIDVIIVGGGLSGLVSAYKIRKKEPSLKILIMEASDRVGGQMASSIPKWITEDHYHIFDLCHELNVKMEKKFSVEFNHSDNELINNGCHYFSKISKIEIMRFLHEIDIKCQQYKYGSKILSTKSPSMEEYIRRKVFFENSRNFFRFMVRLSSGVNASDIHVVEFMNICHGNGNFSNLISLVTGLSSSLIEINGDELINSLRLLIGEKVIMTNTRVIEILHYTRYVGVLDNNQNRLTYCSTVVVAIPSNEMMKIRFWPVLPEEMRIPAFSKIYMVTAFLSTYKQSLWSQMNPTGLFYRYNPCIIGYELQNRIYGGIFVHEDDLMSEIKPIVLSNLEQCLGDEISNPTRWKQETFEQHPLINLPKMNSWNRIVWASSSSSIAYRGLLSGAVQSGLHAGIQTLLIIRPQTVNWIDINEIQRATPIFKRAGLIETYVSKINVYNTVFYTAILGCALILFQLGHNVIAY